LRKIKLFIFIYLTSLDTLAAYDLPDPATYHDTEWLQELIKGNPNAFRSIYETYQQPLFSFAFYLTKSKDIAEEVLQEVFIKLWEKRAQFQPDTLLLPYLKKMTQNLVLDLFRKANRDRGYQQHLYQAMIKASRQTPDVLLEKELSHIYFEAIQQLTPQQKLIYSLHRDEELNYQEIADRLGLSHNTVRNHMTGAIRSIRHYVENRTDLVCLLLAICAGAGQSSR
jgi:RNA polymerase sigma-70 factor (family 1)